MVKTLTLQGTKTDILAMLQQLITRYGKDTTLETVLNDHKKEHLNLV